MEARFQSHDFILPAHTISKLSGPMYQDGSEQAPISVPQRHPTTSNLISHIFWHSEDGIALWISHERIGVRAEIQELAEERDAGRSDTIIPV